MVTLENIKGLRARYCKIHGIDDSVAQLLNSDIKITEMDQAEHFTEFLISLVQRGNITPAEDAMMTKIGDKLDEFVAIEALKRREQDGEFYES